MEMPPASEPLYVDRMEIDNKQVDLTVASRLFHATIKITAAGITIETAQAKIIIGQLINHQTSVTITPDEGKVIQLGDGVYTPYSTYLPIMRAEEQSK